MNYNCLTHKQTIPTLSRILALIYPQTKTQYYINISTLKFNGWYEIFTRICPCAFTDLSTPIQIKGKFFITFFARTY